LLCSGWWWSCAWIYEWLSGNVNQKARWCFSFALRSRHSSSDPTYYKLLRPSRRFLLGHKYNIHLQTHVYIWLYLPTWTPMKMIHSVMFFVAVILDKYHIVSPKGIVRIITFVYPTFPRRWRLGLISTITVDVLGWREVNVCVRKSLKSQVLCRMAQVLL